ncbi:MAG: hypothetical protein ACRD2W_03650 [Acidimicrobiales bacterium]
MAPTTDRDQVERAISRLSLGPRTAVGEAIFASLDAVAAAATEADDPAPAHGVLTSDGFVDGRPSQRGGRRGSHCRAGAGDHHRLPHRRRDGAARRPGRPCAR